MYSIYIYMYYERHRLCIVYVSIVHSIRVQYMLYIIYVAHIAHTIRKAYRENTIHNTYGIYDL